MAVNTLLYTWMAGDKFLKDTPARVLEVVANASVWLVKNLKKAKAYNVVFSGSVKTGAVSKNNRVRRFKCDPFVLFVP